MEIRPRIRLLIEHVFPPDCWGFALDGTVKLREGQTNEGGQNRMAYLGCSAVEGWVLVSQSLV